MPKLKRCGIIFTSSQNSSLYFLLVKGKVSGIWSFPKGCKNKNETDKMCAIRECKEETGVVVEEEKCGRYVVLGGNVYFIISSDKFDINQSLIQDKNEIGEARWVEKEELAKMECNKDLRRFLKKIDENK